MKVISWNVNGIRACAKKGFKDFIDEHSPDLLFLQETKVAEADIPDELKDPYGYQSVWHSAERKGYSGVAILSRVNPDNVIKGFGIDEFDREGRVIQAVFSDVYYIGVYFPNGQQGDERLDYKLRFYDALFTYCDELRGMGKKSLYVAIIIPLIPRLIWPAQKKTNKHQVLCLLKENGYQSFFGVIMLTFFVKYIQMFKNILGGRIDLLHVKKTLAGGLITF